MPGAHGRGRAVQQGHGVGLGQRLKETGVDWGENKGDLNTDGVIMIVHSP